MRHRSACIANEGLGHGRFHDVGSMLLCTVFRFVFLRSPNVTLKEEKMARRTVLTSRQRPALFCVPEREADLLRHYTLS